MVLRDLHWARAPAARRRPPLAAGCGPSSECSPTWVRHASRCLPVNRGCHRAPCDCSKVGLGALDYRLQDRSHKAIGEAMKIHPPTAQDYVIHCMRDFVPHEAVAATAARDSARCQSSGAALGSQAYKRCRSLLGDKMSIENDLPPDRGYARGRN